MRIKRANAMVFETFGDLTYINSPLSPGLTETYFGSITDVFSSNGRSRIDLGSAALGSTTVGTIDSGVPSLTVNATTYDTFHLQWTANLTVSQSGNYYFDLPQADGAILTIDGQKIIFAPSWAGDNNLDGVFDGADIALFNKFGGYLDGRSHQTWLQGDFTGDGIVDDNDILYLNSEGAYQGPVVTAGILDSTMGLLNNTQDFTSYGGTAAGIHLDASISHSFQLDYFQYHDPNLGQVDHPQPSAVMNWALGNGSADETSNLNFTSVNAAIGSGALTFTQAVAPPVVSPKAIHATAGSPFTGVVGTFTPAAGTTPSDYTATISWNWGTHAIDSTDPSFQTTTNPVSITDSGNNTFSVSGTHTYAASPDADAVVTVTHKATTFSGSTHVPVTITNPIAPAVTAFSIVATPGVTYTDTLATFTSSAIGSIAGDYAVSVNWGDGTALSTTENGQVSVQPNGAGFLIVGSHTYAVQPNAGQTSVTVTHKPSGLTATQSAPVTVTLSPPNVTRQADTTIQEGQSFTYSPTIVSDNAADLSETINWGDGGASSTTTGDQPTSSHTFETGDGLYTVQGTLLDPYGGTYTIPDVTVSVLPTTPSELTASAISASTVDLTWTNNSQLATSLNLDVSSDGGTTFKRVASLDSSEVSYTLNDLTADTAYTFRLSAVDAGGTSAPSTQTVTTPAADSGALVPNDDGSTGPVDIGFGLDIYGAQTHTIYVNNNGNITFNGPMGTFTPGASLPTGYGPIIAPFFADVDTRTPSGSDGAASNTSSSAVQSSTKSSQAVVQQSTGSTSTSSTLSTSSSGGGPDTVTYFPTTIDGHRAFEVDWTSVDYYSVDAGYTDSNGNFQPHQPKQNTFSVTLIDRSDVHPGDFDIDFHYGDIQWDTGDASGGQNGRTRYDDSGNMTGYPARIGYSDGTGRDKTFYEVPGSGTDGAFVGSGPGDQHFEIRAAAELAWNTDDNGPVLQGALIPYAGGAPIPLAEYQMGGKPGGDGLNVDWGDGSAPDDGSTLHFYGEGSYSIQVSTNQQDLGTISTDIAHTSNPFDQVLTDPFADVSPALTGSSLFLSSSSVSENESVVNSASPAAGPTTTPPLIKSMQVPVDADAQNVAIAEATKQSSDAAVAAKQLFVGIFDLELLNVEVLPIPVLDPRTGKMVDHRIHFRCKPAMIPNLVKRQDGTYVGPWNGAPNILKDFATAQRAPVTDDGKGHLQTTLQDGTTLDYQPDGDFGVLLIQRPNQAQVKVVFAFVYKEIKVLDAAGQDITDIDRLDGPTFDTFIEEKDGSGLLKAPDLQSALPKYIQVQVLDKAAKYAKINTSGTTTGKNKGYVGSAQPPPVDPLKKIRKLRFEFKATSLQVAGFKAAVDNAITTLRTQMPGWTIDSSFVP